MTFTLSDCITRINQVLNYPSVSYVDIDYFFDQAISELNSELNIGLRPISEIYKNSTFKIENLKDFVMLETIPTPVISGNETSDIYFKDGHIFYKKDGTNYVKTTKLYGIYSQYEGSEIVNKIYETIVLSGEAYWTPYHIPVDNNVDLTNYLPYDWIVLYLIPYVCFKYAVRDGDSGVNYAEDFSNGFQQLRNSYDIPHTVNLAQQAGKKAYIQDLEELLPNINVQVPTRAIYESMKVPRNIPAQYGSMYDRGGWNI